MAPVRLPGKNVPQTHFLLAFNVRGPSWELFVVASLGSRNLRLISPHRNTSLKPLLWSSQHDYASSNVNTHKIHFRSFA